MLFDASRDFCAAFIDLKKGQAAPKRRLTQIYSNVEFWSNTIAEGNHRNITQIFIVWADFESIRIEAELFRTAVGAFRSGREI